MPDFTTIQKVTIYILPLLFAITLHEAAHGYVAWLCGDHTAKLSGRLSLNPIKHIDPVGTILIPLVMIMLNTGFIFGWAKPVPVDARNMHHPRRDLALVALAGPLSNFLMALLWGFVASFGLSALTKGNTGLGVPLNAMGSAGVIINVFLGVLNLIPLPPLDGSRILSAILPPRVAYQFSQIEPYGLYILILLLYLGVLSSIMMPIVSFLLNIIANLFGL